MNKHDLLVRSAIASLITVGAALTSTPALAAKAGFEKCMGVVKAGMNDCGTSKHACAGQSKTSGDKEEWLYVPEGTCKKLVNGEIKPSK